MHSSTRESLPVAVIGGGPVGLAAAAHLIARGLPVKVYEAGPTIGADLRTGARPRRHALAPLRRPTSAALLARQGWRMPDADAFPTGGDLVSAYLEPLAATPELAAVIETSARVTEISRHGLDKVVSRGREALPFVLIVKAGDGMRRDLARAMVDASGTWTTPNPLGASGLLAVGEAEVADRITYGIPDILGRDRHDYAGRKTLVVGSGHSAANTLLELTELAETGRALRFCGRHEAPTSREFIAAATRTNCRRAASSARMSESLWIKVAWSSRLDSPSQR